MEPQSYADLHIHTTYSDSSSSVEDVLCRAQKGGFRCIAIADHDIIDAWPEAQRMAPDFEIEVLTGVELSTQMNKKDIHMLGYCFDPGNEELQQALSKFQNTRVDRTQEILDRLKSVGIDNIMLEEVMELTEAKAVGRPHVAEMLVKKGWVKDIKQAFDRYLAEGGPAFVPKHQLTPYEAIELIRNAGGITAMAHPCLTQRDELIPSFVEAGMKGIEVYYPNCPGSMIKYYENLAEKYQLLRTGGSDDHGARKKNTRIGRIKLPYSFVEELKEVSEYYRSQKEHNV